MVNVLTHIFREDLVNRLINDPENKDLWFTRLLGNQFCKDMGNTGPNDSSTSAVLKGFKAYMVVRMTIL